MKKELEKRPKPLYTKNGYHAGLAQLVAQLICNHQVGGSNPSAGTIKKHSLAECFFYGIKFMRDLFGTDVPHPCGVAFGATCACASVEP